MVDAPDLAVEAGGLGRYINRWIHSLAAMPLDNLIGGRPHTVGILSVDMINGFCAKGPLASDRVAALVPRITALLNKAHRLGIKRFVFTQDTHDTATPEFDAFPPHCVRDTAESQMVDAFKALPFADSFVVIAKNSISSTENTQLRHWMAAHAEVTTWIVVGNCTDLCVYQAAMGLRLEANALNIERRVIVASDTVDTFDTPYMKARKLGIFPHPGDALHAIFLYHMALNGIEVVKTIS